MYVHFQTVQHFGHLLTSENPFHSLPCLASFFQAILRPKLCLRSCDDSGMKWSWEIRSVGLKDPFFLHENSLDANAMFLSRSHNGEPTLEAKTTNMNQQSNKDGVCHFQRGIYLCCTPSNPALDLAVPKATCHNERACMSSWLSTRTATAMKSQSSKGWDREGF